MCLCLLCVVCVVCGCIDVFGVTGCKWCVCWSCVSRLSWLEKGCVFVVVPSFCGPRFFCCCVPVSFFGHLPKKVSKNVYYLSRKLDFGKIGLSCDCRYFASYLKNLPVLVTVVSMRFNYSVEVTKIWLVAFMKTSFSLCQLLGF